MYISTWIFGVLTLISLGSMLARKPWTIIVAKRATSPDAWSTDLFLETNMIITGAWALLFFGQTILSRIAPGWLNIIYGILLMILGGLSGRFGHWYSNRRLKAMGLLEDREQLPDTPSDDN